MSPKAIEELPRQILLVKAPVTAGMLWERVLSEPERRRLGSNLQDCYRRLGTAGMWRELHGGSWTRTVLEIAHVLNMLDEATYRWLLRETGESAEPVDRTVVPTWDPDTGELRWQGRRARHVRVLGKQTNIKIILDTFQAAGRPARIDNPLPGQPDPQRLHQAVYSLNAGLQYPSTPGSGRCWSACRVATDPGF
jgi:hypothetical protein